METAKQLLSSPWTWASAAFTSLLGILGFIDPVWHLLGSTASYWFPAVAVTASTIAPNVGWLDASTAQSALLIAAFVYIAILVDKFGEKAATYWKER